VRALAREIFIVMGHLRSVMLDPTETFKSSTSTTTALRAAIEARIPFYPRAYH